MPGFVIERRELTRMKRSTYVSAQRVRLVSRGTSVRIRFGSPFSSKFVVCGHCLATLSLTVNETLKRLSSQSILMQKSGDGVATGIIIISLSPHLHTSSLSPFSPSLISLMVSVDVEHHVYLLTYNAQPVTNTNSVGFLRSRSPNNN